MDRFEWMNNIRSDHGPQSSTTRLVLLTLATYMDPDCDNCFPSTKRLSSATKLSERCVCEHLAKAAESGWIKKIEKAGDGQAWKHHAYKASIPEEVLIEGKRLDGKGTDGGSARYPKGTDPHSEGTDSHDIKALTEGQSTSTYTSNNGRSFLLKDRTYFYIDDEFYDHLKSAFPQINIDQEIKKLCLWCYSNDKKRKTRKGAKRFVDYWMTKAKPSPKSIQDLPKEFDFENQFHEE